MNQIGRGADGASSHEEGPSAAPDLADLLRPAGEATRPPSPSCTTRRPVASSGSRSGWSATRPRPRRSPRRRSSRSGKTSSRFDPAKGSPLGWLLTIVHRKAVDRVRSAEALDQAGHDVPPAEPAGRARLDRRGRHGLAGGAPGPQRTGQPHDGAARGARAGLLRRLHTHRGGDHARAPGRHRQDPHQGRAHPTARHHGGGDMNEIHALSGRLRRRRARRRRARPVRAAPRRVPGLPQPRSTSLREAAALLAETTRHRAVRRSCATGCSPTSPARAAAAAGRQRPSRRSRPAAGAAWPPSWRPPRRSSRSGPAGSSGSR